MLALATDGGEVEVPPTLRALLAARLDQLEPRERSVLERGAVEGEVFHRGAVQALLPDETQVTPHLAALVRKELIRPDKPQLAGEDGFRFRHLLLRDAAYEALPKAVRSELHERFATWLEQRGAELVELDELLGYHLEQACRYHAELGRCAGTRSRSRGPGGRAARFRRAARVRARRHESAAQRAASSARRRSREPGVQAVGRRSGRSATKTPRRQSLPYLERAEAHAEAGGDPAGAALARAIWRLERACTMLAGSAEEQEATRAGRPAPAGRGRATIAGLCCGLDLARRRRL